MSRARDYIRAMVCGYPSPPRQRKPLLMLRAFIDETVHQRPRNF